MGYSVGTEDDIIAVLATQTTTSTITLPLISTLENGKKRITIADEGGNAGTNNITIAPSGSDQIIGTTGVFISENFNSVNFYSNETDQWFIY